MKKILLSVALCLPMHAFSQDASQVLNSHRSAQLPISNACSDSGWAIEQAASLSGLAIRRYTPCETLGREQFRALAKKIILQDTTASELPYEERVLKFLGIIPENYAYATCLVDAYATSAAAFYSPYIKKFAVPNWAVVPKAILVHESEHALQDQYFNTKTMATDKFLLSDENLAGASLLEGDAMEVEGRYVDSIKTDEVTDPDVTSKLDPLRVGCDLPPILNEILTAPYDYGLLFVRNLKSELGDSYRKKVFTKVPTTTRQILHYKEYLSPTAQPQIVTKPAVFSGTIGEMSLRILLRNVISMQQAVVAAAGLSNDKLVLIKHSNGYKLIWKTLWDRDKDVQEFKKAIAGALHVRFKVTLNPDATGWEITTQEYPIIQMSQHGLGVTISAMMN